nr:cell division protein FtsH [Candidatus Latescibacterota bacterium]
SEETAAEIDDEVRRIVSEGYQRVRELLENNTDALHRLANALIERENLQGDEVREILRGSLKETETSAA